ncbi:MAG: cell division protein FtsX [Bacteroidetes bacterium]|nr:cell division protein FtsX [Bacteroidota bacterium]HET6245726.1 permease-like cell division protein FtsX [Bacteroidia bacterium]
MANKQDKSTGRRLKTSYFTTVISITLVLFMLGLLGLIVLHAQKLSDHVKENIGISVILKENVKEVDIIHLQKSLDASNYVKSTEYITKEQAAKSLQEDLGEDFISFLGFNPLLSSIDVHLHASFANNDSIAWIEKELISNTKIKEVFYQKSLVEMVNENVKKISIILLGFSSLLLMIAIVLINNTIRLSIYSKRFLIKSMQLVGATSGFIRKPFMIIGIAQGIYGAFIAIGLLVGVLYLIQKEVPELFELQDMQLFLYIFGIVLVLGVFISWICTMFAVTKFLRLKTEDLY